MVAYLFWNYSRISLISEEYVQISLKIALTNKESSILHDFETLLRELRKPFNLVNAFVNMMSYPPVTNPRLACVIYACRYVSLRAAPLRLPIVAMGSGLSGEVVKTKLTPLAASLTSPWTTCYISLMTVMFHFCKTSLIFGSSVEALWMRAEVGKGYVSGSNLSHTICCVSGCFFVCTAGFSEWTSSSVEASASWQTVNTDML